MMLTGSRYNEKTLVQQIASGDQAAFSVLFKAYSGKLAAVIFNLTRSKELTQEIVQDVFLKIWMHRETVANLENFGGYLFVISRNQALNALKRIAKEKSILSGLENKNDTAAPETEENESIFYGLLDDAIDRLPPQQKRAYILSRHQRLKYQEIADEMNLSKETVKKYLQAATVSITGYINKNMDPRVAIIFFYLLLQ